MSESKLAELAALAPVVRYVAALNGSRGLRAIDPAIEQLAGHAPGELTADSRRFRRLIHPDDLAGYRRCLKALEKTGAESYEYRFRSAGGDWLWIRDELRLLSPVAGKAPEFTGLMIDITASKVAEGAAASTADARATLRRPWELLDDATGLLADGFALFDAEDRLVMCNERYRDFNTACADIIEPGVTFTTIVRTGGDRRQYDAPDHVLEGWLEHHLSREHRLSRNLEYLQTDGRWVEYSNHPTRQGGLVVILKDVTARKQMEQAVRDSEALIRMVLEAAPLPIGMTRAYDGMILYESPSSKQLFQRDADRSPVSASDHFVNKADRQRYVERIRRDGTIDGFEAELKKTDGSRFWAAISGRLIDYQGERVIVSSTYDLTERRHMEDEMARQREALHQSEKLSALGELLAGVAHELNNPLSVVVGQALLLKETADDPAITDRAQKIGNAADRCARIVKTFLAMARNRPRQSRAVDLNEIVEAALEVTAYSLRVSDIDVSLRLCRTLPPVLGDPDQLNQVLTNLIVNAHHALQSSKVPRELKISTSVRKHGREVVVKVKDNGPGIPPEIRQRIFEPFFTTKAVGSGTGIGLAVCHRILDGHGGRIKVESEPGEGTAFVLRLPPMEGTQPQDSDEARASGASGRLSVLVVDDEPAVANTIAEVLASDGHAISLATSGLDALDLIARQSFDIILSDLRMPGMDGPAFCNYLQRHRPDLLSRLAFMTGDNLSAAVRGFLQTCNRPFVEKPVTPKELRALVQGIVHSGSLPGT